LILHLLAQIPTTQPAPGSEPLPWYYNPGQFVLPLFIGIMVLFLFSTNKSKKAEDKHRTDMLQNLKRGDRVLTIGGILGAVVDVKENEVTLKVDESSNTKVKFTRDAIKRVLSDEDTSATK
jgi:preprotein translocase subunit YajC